MECTTLFLHCPCSQQAPQSLCDIMGALLAPFCDHGQDKSSPAFSAPQPPVGFRQQPSETYNLSQGACQYTSARHILPPRSRLAFLRALQLLAKKADVWDEGIEQLFKDRDGCRYHLFVSLTHFDPRSQELYQFGSSGIPAV